jgi:type IV secretory pathway TraG/TraD family ATPase VirD4
MSKLPTKSDLPTYFILDELSSLYLPTLSITLANCRKYRVGIMMLLQSYEQLIDIYGKQDAESMRTNTFARVYMGSTSQSTSVDVSNMLGRYEWEDEKGKKGLRLLMAPEEVRQLADNKAIMIAANHPPMLLDLRPYYKNPFLRLKTEQPYREPQGQLSDFEVELISD